MTPLKCDKVVAAAVSAACRLDFCRLLLMPLAAVPGARVGLAATRCRKACASLRAIHRDARCRAQGNAAAVPRLFAAEVARHRAAAGSAAAAPRPVAVFPDREGVARAYPGAR